MKWTANSAGLALIKGFEGLELHAYLDKAGVWTIGYGCTYYPGGKRVQAGDKLENEQQASDMLMNVLSPFQGAVNSLVKVALTQNQYNAILSFTYNEGIGALTESTLLRDLNAGNYQGAADQFPLWNKITDPKTGKKVVLDDLVKRRAKERATFLT
ncbi:MAG: lysozyme [Mucilaginibacter sp.]